METTQNKFAISNDLIFWEGPGWYYYMNGWKYSLNQTDNKESDIVKFYSSRDEAERIFCKVLGD